MEVNNMKCIYCKKTEQTVKFTHAEHAIPQAFGLFEGNIVLHNMVCNECNQYFGDYLELALARDSIEGFSRFKYNLKKEKQYKSYGKKSRTRIRANEGALKGVYAYLQYDEKNDRIMTKPFPQIGFLCRDHSSYEYFRISCIDDDFVIDTAKYDLETSSSIRTIGVDLDFARTLLGHIGINLHEMKLVDVMDDTNDSDGTMLCSFESPVDKLIMRVISKIAFNYLAFWEGPEFVLREEFDLIREYIRFGENADTTFVKSDGSPILFDEPTIGKRRLGHIITVDWGADGVSIRSQVSLLNMFRYTIVLTDCYHGTRPTLTRGHFFHPKTKDIFPLEYRK